MGLKVLAYPSHHCNVAILPVVTKGLPISPRGSRLRLCKTMMQKFTALLHQKWLNFTHSMYTKYMCMVITFCSKEPGKVANPAQPRGQLNNREN